jgi:hypothetical protein
MPTPRSPALTDSPGYQTQRQTALDLAMYLATHSASLQDRIL